MRILILSAIFLACFYYFLPSPQESAQVDALEMRVSAPTRQVQSEPPPLEQTTDNDIATEVSEEEPPQNVVVEVDPQVSAVPADVAQVEESPESDQEKDWLDELSHVLMMVEPEQGEEMFNTYVAEKKSFQSILEEVIQDNQKNPDIENLIAEIEEKHEERLKEILGRHYEEIKDHQSKFMEATAQ
jgi:hypothetical protein